MLPGLMKNMAKLFAMLLLLSPVNSFSLGLGEINLHSALNQSLDAEIGLLSVGNIAAEDIVVKLASKEAFDKAGLERPFFLTKLKFTVAKRANGDAYLKITSHDPVNEPFLDFIIEANWPSGRVLREYTLLLDPPVLVDERPAALDIPLFESKLPADSAASSVQDVPTVAVNISPVREVPRFTPRTSTVSRSDSGEITYGPVKRTDTLWMISSEMRPDRSVTVHQVMIALLNENPDAFENQNINDLKAGYFLRISDSATIAAISPVEAERIAKLQYDQWVDAKYSSALAAGQRPLGVQRNDSGSAAGGAAVSRLKLVAADDSTSQTGSGSKLGAGGGDVRQELAFALESADVSRQENEELRKRLSALEEQLSSMQRLITLKGDTLSAMQLSPETVAAVELAANDSAMLPVDAELSNEVPATDIAEAGDVLQGGMVSTREPKTVPPPVAVPPAPMVEPSIIGEVLSVIDGVLGSVGSMVNIDSLLVGIDPILALGGLALVGLVAGALVIRRRKMAAFEEELADINYSAPLGGEAAAVDEHVSDEAVESVLNDVIPEYSGSGGMDVSDDDEIDAIAEADVYLAYRRFDKAEELLREAVQNEPARHDIQVKLLEVYAASDKKDAFIEQAESLRASLGSTDNDTWKSVAEMGRKIAPTSVLFNDEVDAVMDSTGISDELDIDLPDLGGDLDLDELDLSDSDSATELEPVSESENPFSDVSSDELDGLGSLDGGELNDAFDALDDLGELEASLDSAMDMVTDVDLQKKDEKTSNALDNHVVSGVAEEALENEFELDVVTGDNDVLDLSEMSDELTFEEGTDTLDAPELDTDTDADADADAAVASGDNTLEFSNEALSVDEPAAVEHQGSNERAVADDLGKHVVSETHDELAFESGPAAPEPTSDELNLDVDSTADKVAATEELVESIAATDSDVEDDLFSGLDESADATLTDEDWLSDFSDEISSLDDDVGELDDSELFSAEDEVGTKLDLARAYIDMGDNESAKGILDEVSIDGNDDQKKDANELIERIA